ncbi:MAG: hypothetical protein OIF50_13965 [Flavobacteriaceae bacterium]|nr:hypothetical protein [Flavobacteriaceae bacterium]
MFKLFSKKKLIKKQDYIFLRVVVKALPKKYSYLIPQVCEEFILDKKPNQLGDKGTYTLSLNAKLESNFSNKSLPQFFVLKDVYVWNMVKGSFEQIELHILEGMLAGFRVNAKYSELDFNKIDTLKIKEKHFIIEEKEFLKRLIGKMPEEVYYQLEIESTFKIELEEENYYVLKDLKDGNYLAMDEKGAVYAMIHDPYEIEKIFDTKESFFDALSTREFNISEYFDVKTS